MLYTNMKFAECSEAGSDVLLCRTDLKYRRKGFGRCRRAETSRS